MKYTKYLLIVFISFLFLTANAFGVVLQGFQGGTGTSTTNSGNVGSFLRVASTSPFLTYDFGSAISSISINGVSGPTFTFSILGANGLSFSSTTGNIYLTQTTSSAASPGFLSAADWTTFNNKISTSTPFSSNYIPLIAGGGSSGPNSPGTMADDATVGTVVWINPNNAKVSDNVRCFGDISDYNGEISHYLKATNFGFSIPSGATINGILVEVEKRQLAGNTGKDNSVRIIKGGLIGSTDMSFGDAWPVIDTYISYGSPSDLWGETWTAEDINNSGFGFVISATQVNPTSVYVDHIRITVYYTTQLSLTNSNIYQLGNNIGIATTSPNALLTINGTSTNNLFSVYTSSSIPVIYINSTGNIGIGTTTPSSKLQVIDSNSSSTMYIGSSVNSGCIVMGDTDLAGVTYVTALNGVLSATTTKPNVCK